MNAIELDIKGAWHIEGSRFVDTRGFFQEWFKESDLREATGVSFSPVQANISRSANGVIRGIHYSIAPEGQAKLITVISGAIDDYVVDVRLSSPTFGQWRMIRLTSENGDALLIDPHLGHAFQARTPDTIVSYLVTAEFNPDMEKGITPYCTAIGINWVLHDSTAMSQKDREAPSLISQRASGLLPTV